MNGSNWDELGGGSAHKNAKGRETFVCKDKTQTQARNKIPAFHTLLLRLGRMSGQTCSTLGRETQTLRWIKWPPGSQSPILLMTPPGVHPSLPAPPILACTHLMRDHTSHVTPRQENQALHLWQALRGQLDAFPTSERDRRTDRAGRHSFTRLRAALFGQVMERCPEEMARLSEI